MWNSDTIHWWHAYLWNFLFFICWLGSFSGSTLIFDFFFLYHQPHISFRLHDRLVMKINLLNISLVSGAFQNDASLNWLAIWIYFFEDCIFAVILTVTSHKWVPSGFGYHIYVHLLICLYKYFKNRCLTCFLCMCGSCNMTRFRLNFYFRFLYL